ncbi:MAG: hypothetical protein HGA45_33690 [Chloroflexales bacterium]|nr:hypothetical protein [Chloroflexales bacterium]
MLRFLSVLLNALFFALFVHPWWDFARYPLVVGGVIGGTLAGLLITLLAALSGLDSPVLDPARQTSKAYWRWLGRLPDSRLAEQLRIAQAYETMRRYLIQIAVSQTPLAGLRQGMQRLLYRGEPVLSTTSVPEIVRLLLQDLGPTYVKLGQVIASRTEMLPPPWQRELSRLHSSVDPFPRDRRLCHRHAQRRPGDPDPRSQQCVERGQPGQRHPRRRPGRWLLLPPRDQRGPPAAGGGRRRDRG